MFGNALGRLVMFGDDCGLLGVVGNGNKWLGKVTRILLMLRSVYGFLWISKFLQNSLKLIYYDSTSWYCYSKHVMYLILNENKLLASYFLWNKLILRGKDENFNCQNCSTFELSLNIKVPFLEIVHYIFRMPEWKLSNMEVFRKHNAIIDFNDPHCMT